MSENKTHWKKLQNPDYIGAYTLMDGDVKDLTVKITGVSKKEVIGDGGKKDMCTVATLEGQKPMILNATNQKMIAKIYNSPYIEDWIGKNITLYVAKVKIAGDTVDALRIRPEVPALPSLTPDHPKWNGAVKALKDKNVTMDAIKKQYSLTPENEKLLTDASI
jgi:hypothetical protein